MFSGGVPDDTHAASLQQNLPDEQHKLLVSDLESCQCVIEHEHITCPRITQRFISFHLVQLTVTLSGSTTPASHHRLICLLQGNDEQAKIAQTSAQQATLCQPASQAAKLKDL